MDLFQKMLGAHPLPKKGRQVARAFDDAFTINLWHGGIWRVPVLRLRHLP
jgi:hypothetical protein